MKKHGFTLAEVLVTLGIIGVVAALTTPALIQNVGNAKVGPKLSKAKATFETAAEMMLTENSANTIISVSDSPKEIIKQLSRYMKVSPNSDLISYKKYPNSSQNKMNNKSVKQKVFGSTGCPRFDSDDGMTFYIESAEEGATNFKKQEIAEGYEDMPNNQLIGYLYVDIDGASGANTVAKDLFVFALYNDGTVRPYGAPGSLRASYNNTGRLWNEDHNCDEYDVNNAATCAGSIFSNGMKIKYQ